MSDRSRVQKYLYHYIDVIIISSQFLGAHHMYSRANTLTTEDELYCRIYCNVIVWQTSISTHSTSTNKMACWCQQPFIAIPIYLFSVSRTQKCLSKHWYLLNTNSYIFQKQLFFNIWVYLIIYNYCMHWVLVVSPTLYLYR